MVYSLEADGENDNALHHAKTQRSHECGEAPATANYLPMNETFHSLDHQHDLSQAPGRSME